MACKEKELESKEEVIKKDSTIWEKNFSYGMQNC